MNNYASKHLAAGVFIASLFLFHGCFKFFHRTSDIRNNMNDADRKLTETITSIDKFRNDMQSGYNNLAPQGNGPTRKPFPQMAPSLYNVSVIVDKLKTKQQELADIRNDFENLMKGKEGKNIDSDQPEWNALKPIKEKFSNLVDDVSDYADEANDIMNDLKDIFSDSHISKINAVELKNQVATLLSNIEKNITTVKENERANPETITALENRFTEIKKLSSEINTEIGDKTEIWSSPDSYVNVKFEAIKKKAEELKELIVSAKKK